jgi:hypothetical protein
MVNSRNGPILDHLFYPAGKPEDFRFPLFAGSSTGAFLSRWFLAGGSEALRLLQH